MPIIHETRTHTRSLLDPVDGSPLVLVTSTDTERVPVDVTGRLIPAALDVDSTPSRRLSPLGWTVVTGSVLTAAAALFVAGFWLAQVTGALVILAGRVAVGLALLVAALALVGVGTGRLHCDGCPGVQR